MLAVFQAFPFRSFYEISGYFNSFFSSCNWPVKTYSLLMEFRNNFINCPKHNQTTIKIRCIIINNLI